MLSDARDLEQRSNEQALALRRLEGARIWNAWTAVMRAPRPLLGALNAKDPPQPRLRRAKRRHLRAMVGVM